MSRVIIGIDLAEGKDTTSLITISSDGKYKRIMGEEAESLISLPAKELALKIEDSAK